MVFIGIYIGNELSFTFRLCGGVRKQNVLSGVQGTMNIKYYKQDFDFFIILQFYKGDKNIACNLNSKVKNFLQDFNTQIVLMPFPRKLHSLE